MDETADLAQFYKALGDETRLRLIALLAKQEPGNAMCVGRLARELETSSSNISQHLRILKALGLLRSRRAGYRIHYFLDQDQWQNYRSLADQIFARSSDDPSLSIKEEETNVL